MDGQYLTNVKPQMIMASVPEPHLQSMLRRLQEAVKARDPLITHVELSQLEVLYVMELCKRELQRVQVYMSENTKE